MRTTNMVVTNNIENLMLSDFSIQEFIRETKKDLSSPTTSTFTSKVGKLKQMTNLIEESLDVDRNGLSKMKKAVKAIYNGGCADCENKTYLSEALEKLGINACHREPSGENAFIKFSFIVKELVAIEKNLMQNINNNLLFPLETILKGDLKGVKNDLKKPFDKAWKEYDIRMSKIEKEKKAQAKEAGLIRNEISGAEIAEETDRERKQFQYHMLDFLIKVNEIETKKDIDLLLHFVEYFNVHSAYFKSALEAIDKFNAYIADLRAHAQTIKQSKEEEKKELIELKSQIKALCALNDSSSWLNTSSSSAAAAAALTNEPNESTKTKKSTGYSLHQLQGDTEFGSQKAGFLLKKSEGKMGVKVWQKRRCEVRDGFLNIWHADETKPPTKINLLTCQIKTLQNENSQAERTTSGLAGNNFGGKNYAACFDLISYNRTYHFQVEDANETGAWISVLLNSRQGALTKEFDSSPRSQPSGAGGGGRHRSANASANDQSLKEMQRNVIKVIKTLPGNDCCVDCNSTNDPTWLSVNFGVLTCIECSGIHRKMGVHISRIQSLNLDVLGTSQMLIARVMTNSGFNDVLEASCHAGQKLRPSSTMPERNEFIRAKYIDKKFVIRSCASETKLLYDLKHAIQARDLQYVLQIWTEVASLAAPLPEMANAENAMHYIIMHDDSYLLPMLDFVIQNATTTNALNTQTIPCGNTPLHYCAIYNRVECAKLLLRSGASVTIKNTDGKTVLDLAMEENNLELAQLIELNDRTMFENVLFDFNMQPEDPSTDFSDDEFEEKNSLNYIKKSSIITSRPSSVTGDIHLANIGTSLKATKISSDIDQPPAMSTFGQAETNYISLTGINNARKDLGRGTTFAGGGGGGHSRAASIDVSGYRLNDSFSPMVGHSTKVPFSMLQSTTRNVSEDSLLPSGDYSHSICSTTNNNNNNVSPHPVKSTGVGGISVFVPGSISVAASQENNSMPPNLRKVTTNHQRQPSTSSTAEDNNYLRNVSEVTLDGGGGVGGSMHPIPPQRKKLSNIAIITQPKPRRAVALYDCDADQDDELSFRVGEVIVVVNEDTNDEEWIEGVIEGDPTRHGLVPKIFVNFL